MSTTASSPLRRPHRLAISHFVAVTAAGSEPRRRWLDAMLSVLEAGDAAYGRGELENGHDHIEAAKALIEVGVRAASTDQVATAVEAYLASAHR